MTTQSPDAACENHDRELWRERFGDFYADSIHVTKNGSIGINCGGSVFVKPLREWHALAIPLHYNPNTSDIVEWIEDYARRALAARAVPAGENASGASCSMVASGATVGPREHAGTVPLEVRGHIEPPWPSEVTAVLFGGKRYVLESVVPSGSPPECVFEAPELSRDNDGAVSIDYRNDAGLLSMSFDSKAELTWAVHLSDGRHTHGSAWLHEWCFPVLDQALKDASEPRQQEQAPNADAARLDWIEAQWRDGIHVECCATGGPTVHGLRKTVTVYFADKACEGTDIRDAIDGAMEANKGEQS